jgi:hypothetical protein
MSDDDKAKPSKSVMGNLPATRPTRMARRRDGDPVSRDEETPAAPRAAAGSQPKAAATKSRPKAAGTGAKSRPKAASKATAKPKAAPRTAAKPKARRAATPEAGAGRGAKKPRAVRSGSPSLAEAKKGSTRTPRRAPAPTPPKGAELVTTAVQATGELAKIGLTLGRQAVKRAAKRLPKP